MIETIIAKLIGLMDILGPFGLFLIMIIQAIIAPIPSELMLMFGGAAFGFVVAGIAGGIGQIFGGAVSFYISKKFGRRFVQKIVGERALGFADKWFKKWGGWAIIMGRFAPFIPFDAVSYGAGLTKISFTTFIVATTIGSFPRAFFYAYLGQAVTESMRAGFETQFLMLSIIICVLILMYALSKKFKEKYTK
ncbi:MAG: VTT domain-containing protein [Nanoarchaeota archaeon]|nr:VTT domain-containing protein [Nanoarchaeota archaeon]